MVESEGQALVTKSTDQLISEAQHAEDFAFKVKETQPNDPLHALTNCTTPFASADILVHNDQDILVTFSAGGDDDARYMRSQTCHIYVTSQAFYVISVVLLEHSLCDGGVFVLVWDNTSRKPWDVCSSWQTPGPDFVTSSNRAYVSIDLSGVTQPSDLILSIRAIEKPTKGLLELRHLSDKEGRAHLFVDSHLMHLCEAIFYILYKRKKSGVQCLPK